MLRVVIIGPEDDLLKELIAKVSGIRDLEICRHAAQYPPPAAIMTLLDESEADAAVISLADYARAGRLISHLAAAKPKLPIIAAHTYCDQKLLMEMMQLGVRELWFPPFTLDQIVQATNRFRQLKTAATPDDTPIGALLAFLPARGGCGATTVAVHTAAALQKIQGPVLLGDFDLHNSIIAFWMKIETRHGLEEALERAHWLDSSLWKSMVNSVHGFDLLTAPQEAAAVVFSGDQTAALLEFARQNYPFVLMDLPDAILGSCWDVLDQASQILVVATPEMASLYLARRKVAHIIDHGVSRDKIRIVLNRGTALDVQPAEVEKFLSLPVAANFGNHYRAVTTAFSGATLVPESSKLGAQFARFAESLAGVPETKEPKSSAWKLSQIFSPARS